MENRTKTLKTGLFVDGNNIFRQDFPIDYKALYDHVARDHTLLRATAYIIVDPDNPEKSRSFVHFLMSTGFKVVQRPLIRTPEGSVRASTAVSLAVDMVTQADNLDVLILVSGDGNLVPAVEHVQGTGRRVEVLAFTDRLSRDLLDSADFFLPIHKVDNIERGPVNRDFRSFDEDPDGTIMGEGGGGSIVEEGDGGGDDKSPEEL